MSPGDIIKPHTGEERMEKKCSVRYYTGYNRDAGSDFPIMDEATEVFPSGEFMDGVVV
jgi:hypothetical protein